MPNLPRTLLIIDDDELSREVLALLAAEAGYEVTTAASGTEALESLAGTPIPDIILTDMQMPGLSGDSLARLLRAHCGPATVLLAMSGSGVSLESCRSFDHFLLKPFTMNDLAGVLSGLARTPAQPALQHPAPEQPQILNQGIYSSLAQSMPAPQLRALYELCLNDADRRIGLMRLAADARDADSFTRAAHAIKGGCGMVGASELAGMADAMETEGLPPVGNQAPFTDFLAASARLRRMLDAQST